MKLEHSIFTSPGTRSVNEDFADVVTAGSRRCYIVCDGLGGHGMGDKASRFVVGRLKEHFVSCSTNEEFAASAIADAQTALRQEQLRLGAVNMMKTTAVVLATDGSSCICLHVGDSRLYHFRGGRVLFHTRDHSIPQMLVLMGDIREDEIRRHPDRNKLIRALGDDKDEVKCEISRFEAGVGDAFLLCSDGFWEPIEDEQMCSLLEKTDSAPEWLRSMSRICVENSRGRSMDNYTAIAVRVKE